MVGPQAKGSCGNSGYAKVCLWLGLFFRTARSNPGDPFMAQASSSFCTGPELPGSPADRDQDAQALPAKKLKQTPMAHRCLFSGQPFGAWFKGKPARNTRSPYFLTAWCSACADRSKTHTQTHDAVVTWGFLRQGCNNPRARQRPMTYPGLNMFCRMSANGSVRCVVASGSRRSHLHKDRTHQHVQAMHARIVRDQSLSNPPNCLTTSPCLRYLNSAHVLRQSNHNNIRSLAACHTRFFLNFKGTAPTGSGHLYPASCGARRFSHTHRPHLVNLMLTWPLASC